MIYAAVVAQNKRGCMLRNSNYEGSTATEIAKSVKIQQRNLKLKSPVPILMQTKQTFCKDFVFV